MINNSIVLRRMFLAILLGGWCSLSGAGGGAYAETPWKAGFSRKVITPDQPMWLAGYASRTGPSEGKIHDLYARAVALRDAENHTLVLVSTDLIGIPAAMSEWVSEQVQQKFGLQRRELMLTCSHTHCGPALGDRLSKIYFLSPEESAKVDAYQLVLNQKVVDVIGEALTNLQPALVSSGTGHAEFAIPRRPPIGQGPFDHEVPVLKITDLQQRVRGIVFGYACHNTTLSFQKFCGDYAGFAALDLEERHPDATALFFAGCGADQNPLPRRKLELAEKYGRQLSLGVQQVLREPMTSLAPRLETAFSLSSLKYEKVPTRQELQAWIAGSNKYEKALAETLLASLDRGETLPDAYPKYPVQVCKLGNQQLTWIALGGEVTVEYSLRLKKELGPGKTWVTGYANDVMAYIPSERIRDEGGYEGESSMTYYQIPSRWGRGIEERIVREVHALVAGTSTAR